MHDIGAYQHSCNHEDTGLCHEDQVVPKTSSILLSLSEQPGLSEGIHVQRKHRERNDAGNTEGAILSDEVDGVGEDDHEGDSKWPIVDHPFDAVDGDSSCHHSKEHASHGVLKEEREVVPAFEIVAHFLVVLDELENHHAGAVVEE